MTESARSQWSQTPLSSSYYVSVTQVHVCRYGFSQLNTFPSTVLTYEKQYEYQYVKYKFLQDDCGLWSSERVATDYLQEKKKKRIESSFWAKKLLHGHQGPSLPDATSRTVRKMFPLGIPLKH